MTNVNMRDTETNGETTTYRMDVYGRLSSVTAGSRAFTYAYPGGTADPVPSSLTRPNGSVTVYAVDGMKRLTAISNRKSDGTVINADAFTYTDAGHADFRDTETQTNGPARPTTAPGTVVAYANNVLNQTTASTGPNRSYTYDADGNMTDGYTPEGYALHMTYDAENRMTSASYTDTSFSPGVTHTAVFTYSADNFIAKQVETVGGVSTETRFVRNGYLCIQERDGNNAVKRSYVWDGVSPGGIGGLLELTQKDNQNVVQHYDYLFDGKGNVSALIDANQTVVVSYGYDEFGNSTQTGDFEQPYRFSTKRYYVGFGIVKYEYRDNIPGLGKWAERDLIGEEGGLNIYATNKNNSLNHIDYFGLNGINRDGTYSGPITPEQLDRITQITNEPFGGNTKITVNYDCAIKCVIDAYIGKMTSDVSEKSMTIWLAKYGPTTAKLTIKKTFLFALSTAYDTWSFLKCIGGCSICKKF